MNEENLKLRNKIFTDWINIYTTQTADRLYTKIGLNYTNRTGDKKKLEI